MKVRAGRQEIDVKPTITDRVVSWFDPKAGLERMRARTFLALADSGGYAGGRRDKRSTKRWRPWGGSADADILPDLPDLQSRSRDLARNVPIATGAIATVVTNVVGDGLTLQSLIDHDVLGLDEVAADAWQVQAEREWRLFCKSADFSGVQNFDGLQALVFRAAKESGDVLVLRRFREDAGSVYGTKLQVIEADRLSNPRRVADTDTLVAGVEINGDGVPVAYHVSNKHPGGLRTTALEWKRVPAKADNGVPVALHLFDRLRPEQTRGVPYLAPVIDALKQLGNYSDAELSAAVVSAMYTVFIESGTDDDANPIAGERDTSLDDNELKLGAGAVLSLGVGEKVAFANPTRPNAAFDPFVVAILRQVGVALELPFELLVKHFTASYSASRAALEMAWQFFRCQRCWHASRFCQVVYEWVLEEAVARGRLAAPGFLASPIVRQAYVGSEWIGPTKMSLDPMKDAQADQIDVGMGTKTIDQVCIERTGSTFERKNGQRAKETQVRREAGISDPAPAQAQGQLQASDDGTARGEYAA